MNMADLQYISNLKNSDEVHTYILQTIRSYGVKHTYKKCSFSKRNHPNKRSTATTNVFKRPLDQLNVDVAKLECGATVEISAFLAEACNHIIPNCEVEGLFRKTGSTARQKEIKASIENGKKLGPQHHVVDVANILKLFLRELPEPLLPYNYHDLFLRCLLLKDKKVEGILLTCLLLPTCHLNTLAYLMEFLHKVANHSDSNKMIISNLAVVITPTVMPVEMAFNNTTRLNHHITVIENLICNAERIGILPESLVEKISTAGLLSLPSDEVEKSETEMSTIKKKKKRRSGSLTRMINGIKKMVGKGSPDVDENCLIASTPSTPCMKSAKKRKVLEPSNAFSSKKKKEILQTLPQSVTLANAPCTPRQPVFSELYLTPKVCAHPNPSLKSKSPPSKQKPRRFFTSKPHSENKLTGDSRLKKSRLSISSRKVGKKQKRNEETVVSNQVVLDTTSHSDSAGRSSQEWRWSGGPWGRKKRPESPLTSDADTTGDPLRLDSTSCCVFPFEADVDLSANMVDQDSPDSTEFVRIPKSEYEAIKSRVSAIENKISEEFGNIVSSNDKNVEEISVIDLVDHDNEETSNTTKVQNAYEKTLEESVRFDDGSTDQLAKRLSKSLKIRHSGENKVIRSPSARKIGTIRRRSRENAKPIQNKSPRGQVSRNMSWHLSMRPDLSHLLSQGEQFYRKSLRRGKPNTIYTGLPQPSPMRVIDILDDTRIHLAFEHDHSQKGEMKPSGKSSSCSNLAYMTHRQFEENLAQDCKLDLYQLPEGPLTRSQVRRASSFHGSELAALNRKVPKDGRECASYMNILHPNFELFESNPEIHSDFNEVEGTEDWKNAEGYFKSEDGQDQAPVTGRESVAKLRSQNAGMVLARMRLFDGKVVDTNDQTSDPSHLLHRSVENCKGNNPSVYIRSTNVKQSTSPSRSHHQDRRHSSRFIRAAAEERNFKNSRIETFNVSPEIMRGSPKKIGSPRKKHQHNKSPKGGSHKKNKLQPTKSTPKVNEVEFLREKNLKKSSSLRRHSNNSTVPKIVTAPAEYFGNEKENVVTSPNNPISHARNKLDNETKRQSSPHIALPDNLKDTIYDVCTPQLSKYKISISPLKDCNRIDMNSPISQVDMNRFLSSRDSPMLCTASYRTPRDTPFIKKPLLMKSPMQFGRTSQSLLSTDCSARRIATPLRAMPSINPTDIPLESPRRQSPRLLAMKYWNQALKS